jgi:hypothetical protein
MMKRTGLTISALALTCWLASTAAFAAAPDTLSYQGRLTQSGTAVTGTVSVTFSLYAAATGGSALWSETQSLAVASGLYSAVLGKTTVFPAGLFTQALFIAVKVGADPEMSPRQELTSTPYSQQSKRADIATAVDPANASLTGNYFKNGGNAFGTTAVLGTTDLNTLEILAKGVRVMRYEANPELFSSVLIPNVIGGYSGNSSGSYGATVAGGGSDGTTCFDAVANAQTKSCANSASGLYSSVGGGMANSATGDYATVSAGGFGVASGFSSTVAGGAQNAATGGWATVNGGRNNAATADDSFAAGKNAKATHASSFVWSGYASNQTSQGAGRVHFFSPNGLSVHLDNPGTNDATGDVDCNRSIPGQQCWVFINHNGGQLISTSSGAYLSSVGVWNNASDRNLKTDFALLDAQDILARVLTLPLTQWRYRSESVGTTHIGPMAQDFYAAFKLGTDDKAIGTVDESGVALAAIQGLNKKLDLNDAALRKVVADKDAQIAAQAQQLASQAQRLTELEAAHMASTAQWQAELATLHASQDDVNVLKATVAQLLRERSGKTTTRLLVSN